MIRCLSFERDMVDARLANPRLVPGKAMACVVGLSRMDIVIVTFADLYTKKTSGPETSFELLKARQRTPLRGVSRNARLSEEKANHWETSDRQCFSSERTGSQRRIARGCRAATRRGCCGGTVDGEDEQNCGGGSADCTS